MKNKSAVFMFISCFITQIPFSILQKDQHNFDCHFAPKYDYQQLFKSPALQEDFLLKISWWQGVFARNAYGIIRNEALTYPCLFFTETPKFTHEACGDSVKINGYWHDLKVYSRPEAVHLTLLVLALDGDIYARQFFKASKWPSYTVDEYLVDQLQRKIDHYRRFAAQYPGFGGYLDGFGLDGVGKYVIKYKGEPLTLWSADNGFLCWALVAAVQVLQEKGLTSLAQLYEQQVRLMANSGLTMFLQPVANQNHSEFQDGITIMDPYAKVVKANYKANRVCRSKPESCSMEKDYPIEEPLLLFLHLYGNWTMEFGGANGKRAMWRRKTSRSRPSYFTLNKENETERIVYEMGTQFLANELFKYLLLPYLDVPIAQAVFLNGERVRSHYSNQHRFPGMFATAFTYVDDYHQAYPSEVSPGITSSLKDHDLIMPFSAYPMFLHPATRPYGAVWYATMLGSTVSQSSFGVLDSIKITGDLTSQAISWDANCLAIIAFGGGLANITRRYLQATDKYKEFYNLIHAHYHAVFGSGKAGIVALEGDNLPFALPSAEFPPVGNYTECQPDIHDGQCQIWIYDVCFTDEEVYKLVNTIFGTPIVLLVLYIAVFKHRSQNLTHRWFTIHLFVLHLIYVLLVTAMYFLSTWQPNYNQNKFWWKVNQYRVYIQTFYIPQCFSLVMSITLFSLTAAFYFPIFYQRWMLNVRTWNGAMLICHVVAFASTFRYPNLDDIYDVIYMSGFYIQYIPIGFYLVLFINVLLAIVAAVHVNLKASATTTLHKQIKTKKLEDERKILISIILYTIVPAFWCLGSQFNSILLAFHNTSFGFNINVPAHFRDTYVFAHTLSTFIALGPYRRLLLEWTKTVLTGCRGCFMGKKQTITVQPSSATVMTMVDMKHA